VLSIHRISNLLGRHLRILSAIELTGSTRQSG